MKDFYREARFQAALNHTNIINIFNYDEAEGRKYLVMEVADRGDLDDRIEKTGRVGAPTLPPLSVSRSVTKSEARTGLREALSAACNRGCRRAALLLVRSSRFG